MGKTLQGQRCSPGWKARGRISESLVFRRSAGFRTGLGRAGGLVDSLQPEDTLSRFGNLRSAKDWRMRPNLGQAGGNDLINPLPCHIQCPRKHPPPLGLTHRGEGVRSQRNA